IFFQKVNTAKGKVNTARPNSAVLNVVRANKGKATVDLSVDKVEVDIPNQNDKPARRPVKYAKMCKNHQKDMMVNGSNQSRMNHSANTIPKVVLTRTGLKPVNSVRPINPKRDILIKDFEIAVLKNKLEKISKEKDDLDNKIEKFENASQSLDKLIGSQITNKSKRGLGYISYNAVPHPNTIRFSPPRIDLSYIGLPDFAEPSVQSYGVKPIEVVTQTSSVKISEPVKENNGAPINED
nr:hypothetical protein [Tanacetum cinerariifolium]